MSRYRVLLAACVTAALLAAGGIGTRSDARTHGGTSGTGQKIDVPSAPTAVTAVAGNGSATVSWTAPAPSSRHPVTGYVVVPVVSGVAQTAAGLTTSTVSIVIGGLINRTTYTFAVQSVNGSGASPFAYSNTVTPSAPVVTPPPPPPTPTPPLVVAPSPAPSPGLSLPSSIAADCSVDVTSALNGFFSGLAAGTTVVLAPGGCYRVDGILTIAGLQGVTISGTGAVFNRITYFGGWEPVIQLYENTNLTIIGLTINGAFASGRPMLSDEADYGMVLAGNHGVNLQGITINGVAGDFINLFPPGLHGDNPSDTSLNYDVSVAGSTFMNSGYHGVTIESGYGVTFSNDSFTNVGLDGIDLEYDSYGTQFAPDGTPLVAGEINITFDHTTWTNVFSEWFVSWQGAVLTKNIVLTNNTLRGFGAWIDMGSLIPNTMYDGLTVNGNTDDTELFGAPYTDAINLTDVNNVTVSGNSFPVAGKQAAQVYGVTNMKVDNNHFQDATTPVAVDPVSAYSGQPWTGNPSLNVTDCGNSFGSGLSLSDGAC